MAFPRSVCTYLLCVLHPLGNGSEGSMLCLWCVSFGSAGSLGRLHISVPLTSLGKKPVVVEIEDLFVVGRSAEVRKLSPEDIEKASLEEKLGKLSLWERKFPIGESFVHPRSWALKDSSVTHA